MLGGTATLVLGGCHQVGAQRDGKAARLRARPGPPPSRVSGNAATGESSLELPRGHAALLYVPAAARTFASLPLAVMLHGAGGRGELMRFTFPWAEERGCLVLAPSSAGRTWDVIVDEFGPDVTGVDAALAATFARFGVDPRRVALGGFSDGASYALSLGTVNSELFTHVIAFSPGFVTGKPGNRRPRIFISHGVRDEVLPIRRTSRVIVPRLEAEGYEVTYREFDGPHGVPTDIGRQAFAWLAS